MYTTWWWTSFSLAWPGLLHAVCGVSVVSLNYGAYTETGFKLDQLESAYQIRFQWFVQLRTSNWASLVCMWSHTCCLAVATMDRSWWHALYILWVKIIIHTGYHTSCPEDKRPRALPRQGGTVIEIVGYLELAIIQNARRPCVLPCDHYTVRLYHSKWLSFICCKPVKISWSCHRSHMACYMGSLSAHK